MRQMMKKIITNKSSFYKAFQKTKDTEQFWLPPKCSKSWRIPEYNRMYGKYAVGWTECRMSEFLRYYVAKFLGNSQCDLLVYEGLYSCT